MPTLIEILRNKGISNPGNGTGDVKRIVAESVDELLKVDPVITSAQIRFALEDDGILSLALINYLPDYVNPSNNHYFSKIPNLKHMRLKEAIKRTLNIKSSFRITFEPQDGKKMHYNSVLFYRDASELRRYIKDRLQIGTMPYVFQS